MAQKRAWIFSKARYSFLELAYDLCFVFKQPIINSANSSKKKNVQQPHLVVKSDHNCVRKDMYDKISRYILQASIGIVFGYFGFLALANPQLEAAKRVSQYNTDLIELVMPVVVFLYIFGAIQITVAVLLVIDKFTKSALITASVILLAVIINLGWNEIALRDFAILAGTVHLYFSLSKNKI